MAQNNGQRGPKKKSNAKIVIFVVEIIFIIVMLIALAFIVSLTGGINCSGSNNSGTSNPSGDHMSNGPTRVEWDDSTDLGINTDVTEKNDTMKGYMNIALFGVDATKESQLYKGSRSDSTMIANINLETGEIKLISLYRDTFLNIGNEYRKCNAAYSYGGAEQAIRMMNLNLDMDIENFVTVNYRGLSDVINGVGGVWIDVDEAEIVHINNYQIGISETLKCDYTPVKETGYQLLDGIQAAAYCRIRYTAGDDFKRAARQREVIMAIEEQAKKCSIDTLIDVFNTASKNIYTSIGVDEILELIKNIGKYHIVAEDGFPQETMRTTGTIGAKGSSVIPLDLEKNVIWLHQFLFEDSDYQVSDTVKEYSAKIASETAPYLSVQ